MFHVYISPLHNVIRIIHKYCSMWTYISIVYINIWKMRIYLITIHSMYMTVHYTARYREFVYCHIFLYIPTISVYIWNTGCMLFQISKKKHPIKYEEQPYTDYKHLQYFYYGAIAPWRREILRQIFFNWKM